MNQLSNGLGQLSNGISPLAD
ncbi:MAG: hypothetical protein E6706_05820, partial [Anaerococcus hydrogenalis]|nr:hypothetical protein [Anaerococcus hydrogenalis]